MSKLKEFCLAEGITISCVRKREATFDENKRLSTSTRRWVCVLEREPLERQVPFMGRTMDSVVTETVFKHTLVTEYGAGIGIVLGDVPRKRSNVVTLSMIWEREIPRSWDVLGCLLSDAQIIEQCETPEEYVSEFGAPREGFFEIQKSIFDLKKFLGRKYHEAKRAHDIDEGNIDEEIADDGNIDEETADEELTPP